MKNQFLKRGLFLGLIVLSLCCFTYLTVYGSETVYVAGSFDQAINADVSSLADVNMMKAFVVKVIEIITLQF